MTNKKIKWTTEKFVEKAKEIHCNFYDYSNTVYVKYKQKVKITCPIHGDFEQTPSHHLNGEGCPKCRYLKSASSKRRNLENVISLANEKHNSKYDYSLITEYKNDRIKYPIICNKHGVFYQSFNNHICANQGCPICGKDKNAELKRYSTEDFIKLANNIHDNFYSYDKTNYVSSDKKVIITCPKHGDFEQKPSNHINGQGCPKCFILKSHIENEVLTYVKSLTTNEVIENDRSVLNGKEIDIYLPQNKIGIEINGLIWHSEKFDIEPSYHLEKTKQCLLNCIKLIHIFEDEWNTKKNVIKSRLKNLLQQNDYKIYARCCEIKEVKCNESNLFLEENHTIGSTKSKIRYGLYFNDELVCLMTFNKIKNKNNSFELLRFCCKLDTSVIGGASKLFNHFIKTHKPNEIISYVDIRWPIGKLYDILGFTLYKEIKPNYYYVINKKRYNRFAFRKDILVNKYNCPKEMSAHEFCLSKKWYRIYDCGYLCYKFINNLVN